MTSLEESILATVVYHDLLNYALSAYEIWAYLLRHPQMSNTAWSLGDVVCALDESEILQAQLTTQKGLYVLQGREELIDLKLKRKKLADDKWKKTARIFRVLSAVPFMRGVWVSGSLAMENSREESDVDVIVVARSGRIWTVRTFLTVLTWFLGAHRHGHKTANRICLNHYITDNSLSIPFQSLYTAELYAHATNVFQDDEQLFLRFQKANLWLQDFLIHFQVAELPVSRTLKRSKLLQMLACGGEMILDGRLGDWLEKRLGAWEGNHIRKSKLFKQKGGRITIDDMQLEFHPDSHESFLIPEFNRRMRALGINSFAHQKDTGLN